MSNQKEHLPVIGVGPLIVTPQMILTAIFIVLSEKKVIPVRKVAALKIPFWIVGIALILLGVVFWCRANFQTKIDKYIEGNRLATTGVYAHVRNPIYSAFFLLCCGAILIEGNIMLFIVPVFCWMYMTILLKQTEEKWLHKLYGAEYEAYCRRVNRCIPWPAKNERRS